MTQYILTYLEDNYVLIFTLVLMYLFMFFSYRNNQNNILQNNPEFYIMAFLLLMISIVDFAEYQFSIKPEFVYTRKILAVIGYSLRPIIGLLCCRVLEETPKRRKLLWIPVLVNVLVYLCTFPTALTVWYTPDNVFHRGPLYLTVFVCSFVYAAQVLEKVARMFRQGSGREGLLILVGVLGIGGAVFIDALSPRNELMFPVLAISFSFYYSFLLRQETKVRDLEQQIALHEQQNQLMMSQIQPHFLYNTLATAAYLCEDDPELAEHTILQFSEYLRQNMKTIGNNEPVPFADEIDHTKIYTEIEMLRFDNIEVNYNLEDMNFRVPALSIQPMVENAIRHGVRSRLHGIINVHSYRDGEEHVVVVSDNGIGFDTSAPPKQDRPHIGLANVQKRIAGMANGTMVIDSVIGEGTTITIWIPDKGKNRIQPED